MKQKENQKVKEVNHDMLPIQDVTPTLIPQGIKPGGKGQPETEGFDFATYLLGLQVGNQDLLSKQVCQDSLPIVRVSGEQLAQAQVPEEKLLSLFKKDDKDASLYALGLANSAPISMNPDSVLRQPIPTQTQPMSGETAIRMQSPWTEYSMPDPVIPQQSVRLTPQREEPSIQVSTEVWQGFQPVSENSVSANEALIYKMPTRPTAGSTVRAMSEKEGATSPLIRMEVSQQPSSQAIVQPNRTTGVQIPKPAVSMDEPEGKGKVRSDHMLDTSPDVFGMLAQHSDLTQAAVSDVTKQVPIHHAHIENVSQVAEGVQQLANRGGGKMTVSLHPPELGRLEIQVSARGNRVEVEMKSESDHAKSAIESKLGDLRHSMQAADLVVSKLEVHVDRELGSGSMQTHFSGTRLGADQSTNQHGFSGHFSDQPQTGSHFARSAQPAAIRSVSSLASHLPEIRPAASGRVDIRI
ncbi:MAG: flagellar hook-length control protein FliK [Deltaproteobacteria bacterium]|nr:flagellar hook-length control protein FliK [Deltaproteobacteria bacterium]